MYSQIVGNKLVISIVLSLGFLAELEADGWGAEG
jgi:hypothetical protein